jgi:hypothetical protein
MKSKVNLQLFGMFSLVGILLLSGYPVYCNYVRAETDANSKVIINEEMSLDTLGEVNPFDIKKVTDIKSQADLIGQQVTVEGLVSAANIKTSADSIMLLTYIQDESGGITAIGLDAKKGQQVRVTGTVQEENGNISLLTQEVTVLDENEADVPAESVPVNEAAELEGKLVNVTADVTAKTEDTLTIDEELTVYIDSTVGSTSDVETGQSVAVTGVIAPNEQKQTRLVLSSMEDLDVNEANLPNSLDLEKNAGYSTVTNVKEQ